MAWHQIGDKPLSEPMMVYSIVTYMSLGLNELTVHKSILIWYKDDNNNDDDDDDNGDNNNNDNNDDDDDDDDDYDNNNLFIIILLDINTYVNTYAKAVIKTRQTLNVDKPLAALDP